MCLAIPGIVLGIRGKEATVDFGGIRRTVKVDLVTVKPGEYVIVHAGYAIEVMDEKDAQETLKILEEMTADG
jgi:hydrogenase expression/formation protein HypC